MRKATMYLFVVLCSLAAFGQDQRQWKVVQHGFLFNQTAQISPTILFTPTKVGVYRWSAYISESGQNAGWEVDVTWTDVSVNFEKFTLSPFNSVSQVSGFMFVPKAGTPVYYSVAGSGGTYNIAFTIEQLQ